MDNFHRCVNTSDSSMAEHKSTIHQYGWPYSQDMAHSDCHLEILESIYIKSYQPFLCKQEWLLDFGIVSLWDLLYNIQSLMFFILVTMHISCPRLISDERGSINRLSCSVFVNCFFYFCISILPLCYGKPYFLLLLFYSFVLS